MKGVVFDEFINMVEEVFDEEMLDAIIEENLDKLPSGGSYTTVGTYDHNEILVLVTALSEKSNIPVADLVKAFGGHLANVFAKKFPDFFAQCDNAIDFFKTIDDHIHVEVHKLYPDAELPKFTYNQIDADQLELIYESKRDFSMLAVGLLEGTAKHYDQELQVELTPIRSGEVTEVKFLIKTKA